VIVKVIDVIYVFDKTGSGIEVTGILYLLLFSGCLFELAYLSLIMDWIS
jgi:hypothetical protein